VSDEANYVFHFACQGLLLRIFESWWLSVQKAGKYQVFVSSRQELSDLELKKENAGNCQDSVQSQMKFTKRILFVFRFEKSFLKTHRLL
jgi:hypothetical protein